MKTGSVFACTLLAALAAFANGASAVNLNPLGTGQVLIFPYYTVNAQQQTLLSIVNTNTTTGRILKVRFHEAYNGRIVMDFNLYLSPGDIWTANVFALSDAGLDGGGAALFTTDKSCTDPLLGGSGTLDNGFSYQRFFNFDYLGGNSDSGPTDDARMREGHIEVILMSDVLPGSQLFTDIKHVNSVPPRCMFVAQDSVAGAAAPTANPATGANSSFADGGLYGAASIVDVSNGVFYAYNADALDGFSYVSLYTPPGNLEPNLASVNDRGNPQAATVHVFASGETLSATYPGSASGSRKIDAVSALFMLDALQNEYVSASNGAIGTDWVLTFPTKHLYVDAQPGGAIAGSSSAFAPFDHLFNQGTACVTLSDSALHIFDREENTTFGPPVCGFDPCPPIVPALPCLETNVFAIARSPESVLGSALVADVSPIRSFAAAGWINWDLSLSAHQLNPATNGNVFHGLPVTGFAATKFVNGAVSTSTGAVLANYSAFYRHRGTTVCTNANGSCR